MHPPRTQDANKDQAPPWYVRSFGDYYNLLYQHRDDASAQREVTNLMTTMDLHAGMRVLDVCCGAGRHLAAMRRAGCDVFGIDLSPQLLAEASKRDAVRGRVARADIRALPFDQSFDAAVNLFTSFGYFTTDEENTAALHSIVRTLKQGGLFAMDHAHRGCVERTLKPRTVDQRGDATITATRSIEGDRVVKHTSIQIDGQTHQLSESVRLYHPNEMATLFEQTGLMDVRIVGGFDGRALDDDADRMITIGRRV